VIHPCSFHMIPRGGPVIPGYFALCRCQCRQHQHQPAIPLLGISNDRPKSSGTLLSQAETVNMAVRNPNSASKPLGTLSHAGCDTRGNFGLVESRCYSLLKYKEPRFPSIVLFTSSSTLTLILPLAIHQLLQPSS